MKFNVEIVYSGLYDCSANVDLVVEDRERRRAEGHRTAQSLVARTHDWSSHVATRRCSSSLHVFRFSIRNTIREFRVTRFFLWKSSAESFIIATPRVCPTSPRLLECSIWQIQN